MDESQNLSHTVWDCKYDVVWIPKYRKKVLYGELRTHLGALLRELAVQKESRIREGHLMPDHIHMLVSIPPKYSVGQAFQPACSDIGRSAGWKACPHVSHQEHFPRLSSRLSPQEILDRAREARNVLSACRLCPRRCGIDRTNGQRGYCRSGAGPKVAGFVPHFGEEPPLVGERGAGTIFFARCNLKCTYCQNHQISQGDTREALTPAELARGMLDLQAQGCSNIEAVSPSHHLPGFLEALALATESGLDLPIVYNTNGYECPETLDLLDGVVDIYLPDLKYAAPAHAHVYSDAEDYVEVARTAITIMHRQVGNLVVDLDSLAVRGLILRHLILPGGISGSAETLAWIKSALPITVTLSLMAQYAPLHRGPGFPPLDRTITPEEYDNVLDLAWEMGFENVFVQDLAAAETGIPDFEKGRPFTWD